MPWYRVEFDLEGVGFGLLALGLMVILGSLHWTLGCVAFLALVVIMLATRDAERTSPVGDDLVLSPCDGVIESVTPVSPPRELRWDTVEVLRVRISSSPFSVNGIRAPKSGDIDSFVVEPGAPSALSTDPDNSDLREAFILIGDSDQAVGLRVATGGLGPRLDMEFEMGDSVRSGRKIGVRRLGGWCDVFLPSGSDVSLLPGMSVVGGETILTDLSDVTGSYQRSTYRAETAVPDVSPIVAAEAEDSGVEASAPDAPATEGAEVAEPMADLPEPEVMPEEMIEEVAKEAQPKPAPRKRAAPKKKT